MILWFKIKNGQLTFFFVKNKEWRDSRSGKMINGKLMMIDIQKPAKQFEKIDFIPGMYIEMHCYVCRYECIHVYLYCECFERILHIHGSL